MVATTGTILIVAAVASAAIAAASAIAQGNAARASAEFNAKVLRQRADQERLIAARQADTFRRKQSRSLATTRANRAGSGITASGSSLLLDESLAGEIELGAITLEAGGEVQASRLEQNAALARIRSKNAQTAGFVKAGTSILTSASSFAAA